MPSRILRQINADFAHGAVAELRSTYARDWKFLATSQNVEFMGHAYQGLDLPRPVLRKLFHDNAVHWFPGLFNQPK